MLDLLQAVVLGTLQGLTEFLPISSSAHLRILPELLGWEGGDPGAAFTAVIQIGTELAVLLYFREDIWRIGSTWVRSLFQAEFRGHLDARMGWFIIVGSLPIVLLGVALKDVIEEDFRSLWIVGCTLVVFGVLLGLADRLGRNEKEIKRLTLRDAVLMGLAQAFALIPGVSRSGATIVGALLLGTDKRSAAEFSFFLAMPTMAGAFAYDLYKSWALLHPEAVTSIAIGFLPAVAAGVIVVRYLLDYVSRHGFALFGWWRILVGGMGLGALAVLG